jgi:hypothetical protein
VQKGKKEAVTFAIHVRTMWYEEKVSNFEIAAAKLKETLQNIKLATLCPERSIGTSLWRPKIYNLDQNTIPFTLISHLLYHICVVVGARRARAGPLR